MISELNIPLIKDCIKGHIYRLKSRNLSFGVFNGKDGFIGIREKFGDRFLDTEYHWDIGTPHGTVSDAIDTGTNIPEYIPLRCYNLSTDERTDRQVEFDKPVADGGKGWYYIDTGEADQDIRPVAHINKELFDLLNFIDLRLHREDVPR